MFVCKQQDSFAKEFADKNPFWYVTLSNDETIYQDDNRPDIKPQSAWLRLKEYCEVNNLHITKMTLQNRSNIKNFESDCDGYYFCKGVGAMMFSGVVSHSYNIGTLKDGDLIVTHIKVPELVEEFSEYRDVCQSEKCLIRKRIIEAGKCTVKLSGKILRGNDNVKKEDGEK